MEGDELTGSLDGRTDAIRRLVAAAVQQQNDVDRFMALHTEEVVIVNIAGRRVLGSAALREAMAHALSGSLARVTTTVDIDDIRFVRPDVAIVSCRKQVHDGREESSTHAASSPLPSSGSLTYVVVEDGGAWHIAAAQTTPVSGP